MKNSQNLFQGRHFGESWGVSGGVPRGSRGGPGEPGGPREPRVTAEYHGVPWRPLGDVKYMLWESVGFFPQYLLGYPAPPDPLWAPAPPAPARRPERARERNLATAAQPPSAPRGGAAARERSAPRPENGRTSGPPARARHSRPRPCAAAREPPAPPPHVVPGNT